MSGARIIFAVVLSMMALASPAFSDPFNVDLKKITHHLDTVREQEKVRVDPKDLLATLYPEVKLEKVKLDDALDWLNAGVRGRLLIDQSALEAAGLTKVRVTVHLKNESSERVLSETLKSAAAHEHGIEFAIVDELIVISNAEGIAHIRKCINATAQGALAKTRVAIVGYDPCTGDSTGCQFGGQTIAEVVDAFSNDVHVAIRLDEGFVKRREIDLNTEMNASVPNVSLACALVMLFENVKGFEGMMLREENGAMVIRAGN